LTESGRYGDLEDKIVQLGFAEYVAQIFGGIPMNQGEIRPPRRSWHHR
jgi:(2S)-methylsuccinyl-CoA dehydrogenase